MAVFKKKPQEALRSRAEPPPAVEWDLGRLIDRVRESAPTFEAIEVDTALVHARLADACRDVGQAPPDPRTFERQTGPLDAEGWRRLALAACALDDSSYWFDLASRGPAFPVSAGVSDGLPRMAREAEPLTVALVRQSGTRAEEFARKLTAYLGVGIIGESHKESQARLHAIDYRRLLAEAEHARALAQEKMEGLRKKQQAADGARGRRGKW